MINIKLRRQEAALDELLRKEDRSYYHDLAIESLAVGLGMTSDEGYPSWLLKFGNIHRLPEGN